MRYLFLLLVFITTAAQAETYVLSISEQQKPNTAHYFSFNNEMNSKIEPITLFKGTENETIGGVLFENGDIKIGLKKHGQYLSTAPEGWQSFYMPITKIENELITFYVPHPSILNDDMNTTVWRPANKELGSVIISAKKVE